MIAGYVGRSRTIMSLGMLLMALIALAHDVLPSLVKSRGNDVLDVIVVYFIVRLGMFFKPASKWLSFVVGVGLGVFLEVLQLYHVRIPPFPVGTFNRWDIVAYIVGGVVALLIDIWYVKKPD